MSASPNITVVARFEDRQRLFRCWQIERICRLHANHFAGVFDAPVHL